MPSAAVLPVRSASPDGHESDMPRRRSVRRFAAVALATAGLLATGAGGASAAGDDVPVMQAAVMLEGHARVGSWMAIRVRLRNDGPAVVGELRLAGGAQGRTRFGTPVDLPTQSDKTYVLYAQPPAFGGQIDIDLVAGDRQVVRARVPFTVHDMNQLVVGVIAEQPQRIVPRLSLQPGSTGQPAAVVSLGVEDLPDRVEAWATLDRLIWQDVDSALLSPEQIAAMRGWLAGGGRLVLAGGTGQPAMLSGFPEEILPYRPTAMVDVPPDSLTGLLGQLPRDATDVPALAGELTRGRALAMSGDRVVAAELAYGSGLVTILGFDPATKWMADADQALWRRFLPPRTLTPVVTSDDGQLLNAVTQLPALALPPIDGLLALLLGYVLLIGPINYLVLRRLDRREWAWITMPVLIVVFAVGSYGFGAALRGLDVILNEVAIVRGAPGTTEGTAQVYLGVFSPSRGTYQLEVPGGALLSSTLSGDFLGNETAALDILQGDPSRIRDLVIGFGSLRTVRAETAAAVPLIHTDLTLVDGTLTGTIRNASDQTLEKPAVVLGSSVLVLRDLAPGTEQSISLPIRASQLGVALSDRILGQAFFGDPTRTNEAAQRNLVRHAVLNQLTYDPNMGVSMGLPSDQPVLLAWGTGKVLDVRVSGQAPRRTGNVLYYLPLPMAVRGAIAFDSDLIRTSVIEVDAAFFNKNPFSLDMGRGSVTLAYRPIAFEGSLAAKRVVVALNFGGDTSGGQGVAKEIEPLDPQPCRDDETDLPGCAEPQPRPACDPNTEDCSRFFDGVPEIELFDRTGSGRWLRLPHLAMNSAYAIKTPGRYVDPVSGTLLVRFVNDLQDGMSLGFQVRIEGEVR